MTDIRMSDQVRDLLGPDLTQRTRQASLAQASCPLCDRPVPAAGPVNVVVFWDGRNGRIGYAHPTCAPSAVTIEDADGLTAALPDEGDMTMRAVMIEHGNTTLPTLVATVPIQGYATPVGPSGARGEATDVIVAALLHLGLALITRLREAPRPLLDWSTGLTHVPDGRSQLLIEPAPGDLFYEGPVDVPDGWTAAADRYGWAVLYSGTGLADPITDQLSARTLRTAAAAGTLAGARLRISRHG